MVVLNESQMALINDLDSPPTYEQSAEIDRSLAASLEGVKDVKLPTAPPSPGPSLSPLLVAGPSMPTTNAYGVLPQAPPVHQYRSATGEIVYGLLPPDHPEMICLQQGHDPNTHYGFLGIIAAIVWFPLGIGLCLLDRRVKCRRCNHVIDEGLC